MTKYRYGQSTGIWLVDKPAGVSSRDLVNDVAHRLHRRDLGHTGTLDPQASGLLILLGGQARKLQNFFTTLAKCYQARGVLGATSETDDTEGHITPCPPVAIPDRQEVERAVFSFRGLGQQKPPAYSAIRMQGKRAYDLARTGEKIDMAAREINIYDIAVDDYVYPFLTFTLHCSAGTYVRALARDLGEKLGTGCYLDGLRRLSIGHFQVTETMPLHRLEPQNGLSLEAALAPFPRLDVTPALFSHLYHGQPLPLPADNEADGDVFVWVEGRLMAWARRRAGVIYPYRICVDPKELD